MVLSWEEVSKVIRCRNAPNYILGRLIGLELADSCSRCGGSGQYSYCQMYGSTCFKCGGSKYQMPKLSASLLRQCKEVAESGKLDSYLVELKRVNEAKAYCKKWSESYFDMWASHPVLACYKEAKVNWMYMSVVESEFNHFASGLMDSVKQLEQEIRIGKFIPEKPKASRGRYEKLSADELLSHKAKLEEAFEKLKSAVDEAKAKYGQMSREEMLALPRRHEEEKPKASPDSYHLPGITMLR